MNGLIIRRWWGGGLVLVLVVAAGAFGLCCLIDGDAHDDQGPWPDLCLTVFTMASAPTLAVGLLLQGWAAAAPASPFRSAWVTVLTPPPRSL